MQPNYNFYGAMPYQQFQQQQFNNQLIFIQSIEEAQNYIVHSNRPVYFRLNNGTDSMFIEKRVDMNGNIIIDYYKKINPQNNTQVQPNTEAMQFVSVNEFEALKNEVRRLQAMIMNTPNNNVENNNGGVVNE